MMFMEVSPWDDEGIDIYQHMRNIIFIVEKSLEKFFPESVEELSSTFASRYNQLIVDGTAQENSDKDRYQQLITHFKPALQEILDQGPVFDEIISSVVPLFNTTLAGIMRREDTDRSSINRRAIILPGTDTSVNICYYCGVCNQEFEIETKEKQAILNTDIERQMPEHHDQTMQIRIKSNRPPPSSIEDTVPADAAKRIDHLMGSSIQGNDDGEYLNLLSVGIDIGSSTSHLIFSALTLKRETSMFNPSNHFYLVNREVLYQSTIIDTPLLDHYIIDVDAVVKFCRDQYQEAGVDPEDVDTGAVIVTGETAKKNNAKEIVQRIAHESGNFVSATAGPNFEAVLGAMGSGMLDRSKVYGTTILHIDVGGGTSNLALVSDGQILSTSCINIGGRLLGFDESRIIWRIDDPCAVIMKHLGMAYHLGDRIDERDIRGVAEALAGALMEVIQGPARSQIARELMMTPDLEFLVEIDEVSFSGGIGEMIYGDGGSFNDIGPYLAAEIETLVKRTGLQLVEPEQKIRATVIGAGAFSLSVSGSTTFFSEDIEFPLTNIQVVPVHVRKELFSEGHVMEEINRAYAIYDLVEGEDIVALYFRDPIYHSYDYIPKFAAALEKALPNAVRKEHPIILLFSLDMGSLLGLEMKNNTAIQNNLLCLDELQLEEGDWIDIGAPLKSTKAFPITVKSLVFHKKYAERDSNSPSSKAHSSSSAD